jgi:hypothetical protein
MNIDADVCDAWAAVVVALSIVCITIPLIMDIAGAAVSICDKRNGGDCLYTPISPSE